MSSSVFVRLVEKSKAIPIRSLILCGVFALAVSFATVTLGQFSPHDPGVRGGTVDSGQPLASLSQTPGASDFFTDGSNRFKQVEAVANGLGQGGAGPDEFRSAPLWGLGQRIFFLHDGRTTDLLDAIREHASPSSEANAVIHNFNRLNPQQHQDLLNFLRSLW